MKENKKLSTINYFSPLLMIAVGVWHYFRHGLDMVTIIPIALGFFALYLAIFNHSLLQRVLTVLEKLWYPIGWFIASTLFVAVFFIVFAPVGILLRLFKKDILNRNLKTDCLSYWIDRSEGSSYTRQF